ncbi:hypothetical protein [Streptomyces olivaceus]|uniref:hypothetical protein n=1 Tax=Streptomyces olivaceus TaxID=47716 RepID=UPI001CCCB7BE|nr:hypothetical protein [Streptomyces olivaceus]MBZ6135753.1 hypothetical protein [Streptomyces olivaceus]
MSDALEKAEKAAREAAENTDVARIVAAVLATQQAAQQQPAPPPHQCEHHQPARRTAGEWIGIACAVCVGGIGIAFASVALAILGGVAAIVVLVLRSIWIDVQKGGR